MRGCGHVGAVLQAGAHLEALVEREVGVEHVEAAVVGVAARRDVPRRRGTARSWPPPPGRATTRGATTRWATNQWSRPSTSTAPRSTGSCIAGVGAEAGLVAGAAERAAQVAAEEAERRDRLAGPPGGGDDGAGLGVGAHHHAVARQRARLAPGLTLRDRQPTPLRSRRPRSRSWR